MRYFFKLYLLIKFICLYAYDLTLSAVKIAWDVVTIESLSHPGIVAVPLDAKTDAEITLVANLITFSPGTMVVDLSEDRKLMYVHTMFLEDEAEAIASIKDHLEVRVLEIMR